MRVGMVVDLGCVKSGPRRKRSEDSPVQAGIEARCQEGWKGKGSTECQVAGEGVFAPVQLKCVVIVWLDIHQLLPKGFTVGTDDR